MNPITLTLPYPLSANRYWRQVIIKGHAISVPTKESKFFLKAVDAQLEFFKDEAGAVTRAVLYQGGAEIQARRK